MTERKRRAAALLASGMIFGLSLFFYQQIGQTLLKYLGRPTVAGTYYLLKCLGTGVQQSGLTLIVPHIQNHCIQPDSIGLIGISLFLSIATALMVLDGKRLGTVGTGLFLMAGVLVMLLANTLRLSASIAVEHWAQRLWGNSNLAEKFSHLAQAHMGWVLYAVLITGGIAFWNHTGARPRTGLPETN